ncbi:DUF350 domain-containing protein [Chitinolyticbacter albus]|uniref:DUF350 domain-containing protein n=1 Tax=Chitinolyticbacter albus TaxID=2961951 RepID=UPI00210969E0|nr:DUF350 domain-containing protein [Chitinolyticbacter albus]
MLPVYGYFIYLLTSLVLLGGFAFIYLRITPFAELGLIRDGKVAAALSFSGALLGFALTLAASIIFHATYPMYLLWAVSALVVQVAAYALLSRLMPHMNDALADNNVAMGALMGTVSLTVGVINAACLS